MKHDELFESLNKARAVVSTAEAQIEMAQHTCNMAQQSLYESNRILARSRGVRGEDS